MRAESATRVALAISWWKMQGVLASSRWPRRSAQASTCRSRKLASIVRSSLIEHLRSRLATKADALTCCSPITRGLCNLDEQSTEKEPTSKYPQIPQLINIDVHKSPEVGKLLGITLVTTCPTLHKAKDSRLATLHRNGMAAQTSPDKWNPKTTPDKCNSYTTQDNSQTTPCKCATLRNLVFLDFIDLEREGFGQRNTLSVAVYVQLSTFFNFLFSKITLLLCLRMTTGNFPFTFTFTYWLLLPFFWCSHLKLSQL